MDKSTVLGIVGDEGSGSAMEVLGSEPVELNVDQDPVYPPAIIGNESCTQEQRSIIVPPNRVTPLKKDWLRLYKIVVEQLCLQIKMDVKKRCIHIRTCKETSEAGALQKAADFLRAYCLGFLLDDALTLVRMDDVYIEVFEIKDVRTLSGGNLSRAIGRIVGKDGKIKLAIENMSRTRTVIAGQKIHILGTFTGIRICRDAIVSLIIGSTPGKVYAKLRSISARIKERS